jgi:hypothetical protein
MPDDMVSKFRTVIEAKWSDIAIGQIGTEVGSYTVGQPETVLRYGNADSGTDKGL